MNLSLEQPNDNRVETQASDRAKDVSLQKTEILDLSVLLGRGPSVEVAKAGKPEVDRLRFGILPLTDCASIVIGHEKGFFEKHGIKSSIAKLANWTASRDLLLSGEAQAAQMLFGMPVAAAVGKLGTEHRPLVIPWILNRNGQAISICLRHRELFASEERDLRAFAQERREKGRPMVFAMTLQPGTHAMWLRYWLAARGIDPDNDVALITIPPPMMVANMRAGRLDGFCAGEPWNARAVEEGLAFTAVLSEEIWPDHPEKVLAFTEEFSEAHPNTVKAVLKALHEASIWCDDATNRNELAAILERPQYLDCPASTIRSRLGTHFDLGGGGTIGTRRGLTFSSRECNYPQPKFAVWWLSQLRRWAMLPSAPDYLGVAARVMRPDFYEAAMSELCLARGKSEFTAEVLFDGKVFDPAAPEKYAADFEISRLKKKPALHES
ncbi:MAG TPA: CmpA/NrtA family ABC transporter substrate-binding protein [Terrimicrobiaceae bacterium]